ncbi:unnamed protein product [Calypogeia fissa]
MIPLEAALPPPNKQRPPTIPMEVALTPPNKQLKLRSQKARLLLKELDIDILNVSKCEAQPKPKSRKMAVMGRAKALVKHLHSHSKCGPQATDIVSKKKARKKGKNFYYAVQSIRCVDCRVAVKNKAKVLVDSEWVDTLEEEDRVEEDCAEEDMVVHGEKCNKSPSTNS